MRCPDTAAFRLSPPLVARLSRAWPFAAARATQICRCNRNQSGTVLRAIALARSDHPAAMGESEPSVTLPRTPPPAIVLYQQGPILQSYPAIDVTDASASRAWVHVGQPAPKAVLKASHKVLYSPRSACGVVWCQTAIVRGLVANCHDSPCHVTILRFGQPFSRQGGHAGKKSPTRGLA